MAQWFPSYFRFTVREFTYNAEELEAGKNEIKKLDADRKKQFVSVLLNGTNFGWDALTV